MTSDIDQPDDFIGQQPNADAAQYIPYAMPVPTGPRCYYCGEPPLAGSSICKRCCDWMNDYAQKKARLSFRLGLAAILTFVSGIAITIGVVFGSESSFSRLLFQVVIFMLPASVALGVISLASAREAKRLVSNLPIFDEFNRAELLRTSRAGQAMSIVTMIFFGIVFLLSTALVVLLIWALFYVLSHY